MPTAVHHQTTSTQSWLVALAAAATLTTIGCANNSRLQEPHFRLGALPFPGPLSLYAAADPASLAPHHYRGWTSRPFASEGDRGILYTEAAGFLDMAHVRLAMDWTWYISQLIRVEALRCAAVQSPAVNATALEVRIPFEGSEMLVRVASLDPTTEQAASIAAATAYRLLTWHEVATWYGYQKVPFISERGSTFTVDDTMSHVVGVNLGYELALLTTDRARYDQLAGELLTQNLADLGAADEATTTERCNAVRGVWWEGTSARLIDANVAFACGEKRPVLIGAANGASFTLGKPFPNVHPDVSSASSWYSLRPGSQTAHNVQRVLLQRTIDSDWQFELLIKDVTREISLARTGVIIVDDATVSRVRESEHTQPFTHVTRSAETSVVGQGGAS